MARLTVGIVFGLVVGVVAGAAAGLHAESDDTTALAAEVGIDEQDLRAAADTVGVSPRNYLEGEGVLSPQHASQAGAVVAAAASASILARVKCIELKESGGANVANARGSGAGGVMQYMPSTFRRAALELGHPEWSLWNPDQARAAAAHDLLMGRRAQWTVGGC